MPLISPASSSPPSTVPLAVQAKFEKTRMCTFFQQGRCSRALGQCKFAHSSAELNAAPDLKKTKLCFDFFRGLCFDEECKFAHGYHELRATEGVYKTRYCRGWLAGECKFGSTCRFAHGGVELRDPNNLRRSNLRFEDGTVFPSSPLSAEVDRHDVDVGSRLDRAYSAARPAVLNPCEVDRPDARQRCQGVRAACETHADSVPMRRDEFHTWSSSLWSGTKDSEIDATNPYYTGVGSDGMPSLLEPSRSWGVSPFTEKLPLAAWPVDGNSLCSVQVPGHQYSLGAFVADAECDLDVVAIMQEVLSTTAH